MSTKTKMVDRNVHTGEKLQSKLNNDNYRSNYDKIFKKTPTPERPVIEGVSLINIMPPCREDEWAGYERFPIAEFQQLFADNVVSPDDGSGFYGVDSFESSVSCFSATPAWATCVYWYNK